jgi:predicted secreted Zn-dependent protease
MTRGELTAELVLPIKRNWNELLGVHEHEQVHRTILSHDYGSVTSVSV